MDSPTETGNTSSSAGEQPGDSNLFKGNLTVIAMSSAIKGFGGGLIGTYVSLYFVELGGDPITLGLVSAIASILGSVMLLFGGFIADYYGRRKIVVLAAFYGVFFPLIYAVVQDWRLFAASSVGVAFGSISNPALRVLIVDSVPPEKRATWISLLQVIPALPVAIAPFIGGWLTHNYGLEDGFRLACIYTGSTAFIAAIILIFLRETLKREPTEESAISGLRSAIKFPRSLPKSLKALMLSNALVAFANGAVGSYYILYAHSVIGLTPLEWAPIASLQSLVIVLKILGGWFSDKFGKRKTMILSLLACAPCTTLFVFSRSFPQVLFVALLLVITGMYYAPAYEALQADLTPQKMRGRITALWQLNSGCAAAFGMLIGGFLFQAVYPAFPFYVFTVVEISAAFFLIIFMREPEKREL